MAAVNKSGTPSFCSPNPAQDRFPTYQAGAAIAAADILSLHGDGLVYPATPGTTRVGVAGVAADIGDPVTPTLGQRFYYATGLTPAAVYYLSATVPGGLDTTLPTGDCSLGFAVDSTRIQFFEKMMP